MPTPALRSVGCPPATARWGRVWTAPATRKATAQPRALGRHAAAASGAAPCVECAKGSWAVRFVGWKWLKCHMMSRVIWYFMAYNMVDVSLRLDNDASVQDADGQYSQASTHENTFCIPLLIYCGSCAIWCSIGALCRCKSTLKVRERGSL